jgi:hypothetical protein
LPFALRPWRKRWCLIQAYSNFESKAADPGNFPLSPASGSILVDTDGRYVY